MRRRNGSHDQFTFQRNRIGFGFWFCPHIPIEQLAKTRIAHNGWAFANPEQGRGGCAFVLCNRRDRARVWRRERIATEAANAVLAAVALTVQGSGPARDGRAVQNFHLVSATTCLK